MSELPKPVPLLSDADREVLARCRKKYLRRPLGGSRLLLAYDLFIVVALMVMGLPGVLPTTPPFVTYLYLAACFVILLQSRYSRRLRADIGLLSGIASKLAEGSQGNTI